MIQIFVATAETQGQRENDFCFVPEGEILDYSAITCSRETTDGNCGCKRSLCGLQSHKATTTMKIIEFDGNIEDLGKMIRKSQKDGGWLQDPWQELLEHGLDHASEITEQASKFPVGTVVEYRDGVFVSRK